MQHVLDSINPHLPQGWELKDQRKKPLRQYRMFGRRNQTSSWCVETPRKEIWFRSIASIYRWAKAEGYVDLMPNSKEGLRTDDKATYAKPKRLCYMVKNNLIHAIIPRGNTWYYRKTGECQRCIAVFDEMLNDIDYMFEDGRLIVADIKVLKTLCTFNGWVLEEVDPVTMSKYQKTEYPK